MAVDSTTDQTLTLASHGRTYRLAVWPGKVASCMRAGRPYEQPLLEHIRQQQFPGTAVDAGANLGNHTMWMAVMCGLQVVAFEPLWHETLTHNVQLNRLGGRVRVEPVALGGISGTAEHTGRGRLHAGTGDVPVRRLDDYQLTNVSLIKADVEGMEPALLRGAEATIRRDRPVIFAEEWGQPQHLAIAAVLGPWRYAMTRRFLGYNRTTVVGRWDPR